jgi:hypothetical protein
MGHCCPLVAYQVVAALASGPFSTSTGAVNSSTQLRVRYLHVACFSICDLPSIFPTKGLHG